MVPIRCIFQGHAWGPWALRPHLIGARVEWLRWESHCPKCRSVRQRWFRVEIPPDARIPMGIGKAIPVERYLSRIGAVAPRPESLVDGEMPTEAWGVLQP
jgi:hypothetical protein